MTQEIAVLNSNTSFIKQPRDMAEAMELATMISRSAIVPRDLQGKPGDVLLVIQLGAELGLPWMTALQSIFVVNSRPTIFGDAFKAIIISSPLCEEFDEDSIDIVTKQGYGRCKIKRRGMTKPVEVRFSIEDAKKAGLWGKPGPWTNYPSRMLQMRARGFCGRDAMADLLKGIITREEAEDFEIVGTTSEKVAIQLPRRLSEGRPGGPDVGESTIKPAVVESVEPTADRASYAKPQRPEPTPEAPKQQETSVSAPSVEKTTKTAAETVPTSTSAPVVPATSSAVQTPDSNDPAPPPDWEAVAVLEIAKGQKKNGQPYRKAKIVRKDASIIEAYAFDDKMGPVLNDAMEAQKQIEVRLSSATKDGQTFWRVEEMR